jgi:hypothetical protein
MKPRISLLPGHDAFRRLVCRIVRSDDRLTGNVVGGAGCTGRQFWMLW